MKIIRRHCHMARFGSITRYRPVNGAPFYDCSSDTVSYISHYTMVEIQLLAMASGYMANGISRYGG